MAIVYSTPWVRERAEAPRRKPGGAGRPDHGHGRRRPTGGIPGTPAARCRPARSAGQRKGDLPRPLTDIGMAGPARAPGGKRRPAPWSKQEKRAALVIEPRPLAMRRSAPDV